MKDAMLLDLKREEEAATKEWGWALEAGKGNETHSTLQPPKETQPCRQLDLAH